MIVNTCGFIDAAKEESIAALLDAVEFAHARGARVAAVGCLVERYRDELAAELPEVDLWCGLDSEPLLAALATRPAGRGARRRAGPPPSRGPAAPAAGEHLRQDLGRLRPPLRVLRHPAHQGRLRAGRGRARSCAPRAPRSPPGRGSWCSSARTRRAGRSRGGAGSSGCSRELEALEPAPVWLRLLYLQPDGIDDALLEALARHAVPYVDVPLQHASGAVLRRMGRSRRRRRLPRPARRACARALPGAAVRSTFIAGFPGETEEDFDELLAFVRAAGLSAAGVFAFDARRAPRRRRMPGQVAAGARLRARRPARRGHRRGGRALLGRRWPAGALDVLVERGTARADGVAVGTLRAAGAGHRRPAFC